ncbi:16358_t:CDS:2 [Dentiscutata erythropus]|uniref:16358_t:CDS:1 n=1 Tax=Dentiscutata erythropus TaxID=1348616 RepID=A0A9N9ET16_9GLOM|nr:16358_t:CDS:2 [Dentiscutata erythropus]
MSFGRREPSTPRQVTQFIIPLRHSYISLLDVLPSLVGAILCNCSYSQLRFHISTSSFL